MGRKGKRPEEGPYTNLPYSFLKSPAWRSLSGAAVKVFLELHTRFNGGNNGQLRLSFNEAAAALGMGKATVQRAFEDLQDKGFLVLAKPGNWYHRSAHEWRLTTKPTQGIKGKSVPTNDWYSWRPEKQNAVPKRTRQTSKRFRTRTEGVGLGPNWNPSEADTGGGLGSETEH